MPERAGWWPFRKRRSTYTHRAVVVVEWDGDKEYAESCIESAVDSVMAFLTDHAGIENAVAAMEMTP
jgi:hypothetical protein